jgi:hypothetical protein
MEVKPIRIYIRKDRLELIEKYDYKASLWLAVEEVLSLPFYNVMIWEKWDYEDAVPVMVNVEMKYALAWEQSPQEVKDRILSGIDERLTQLVYSYAYMNELEGGK